MNDDNRFAKYKFAVEKSLSTRYQSCLNEPQQILFDSMNYSLLAGGKRIRPVLVCEFCNITGGNWETSIPFACALEMIHTYSLIHDDLPSMDNDRFRRGKPTNHVVYGDAVATLAGDALLTDAFSTACSAQLGSDAIVSAVKVLSQAAGSCGMVGGQVLDILSETRECSEKEVIDIQSRKTGCLIEAACVLGVIAGGGNRDQLTAAQKYAKNIGIAFQIRDDILDVIGSFKDLGKSTGSDQGKNTFVRIYGVDRCRRLVCSYTQKAIESLQCFEDTEELVKYSESLNERMS